MKQNQSGPIPHPKARKKDSENEANKRTRLTQKVIVETAAELFAQRGFGATSLNDIADALGVTKVALYYHVKNKEEILRLVYLTVLNIAEEPLRRIVESDLTPREKLHQAIEHHIAITANTSPAVTVFYREQAHLTGPFAREIALREKDYERYFEQIIQEGIAQQTFKPGFDSKIVTFGLLGMCHWLSHWYQPAGRYTPQQIATMFITLIENGLLSP
ncbi:TetR/AcrR family transcriptional regulator [Dictyobacter formicarum]|uniref:Transcriptional regulator, TetR family protein n=1 Tax=Dictyobacter formicarum TaxID=2778368 RepID=A0ABQ3VFH6_9CHLR|nr:TetR/AcrR family transcriptional regulator [Dictyobacter formicarum]GHO84456.1 putative transcriptional regulator, TetR family protein [Dictyobacter formicarum]